MFHSTFPQPPAAVYKLAEVLSRTARKHLWRCPLCLCRAVADGMWNLGVGTVLQRAGTGRLFCHFQLPGCSLLRDPGGPAVHCGLAACSIKLLKYSHTEVAGTLLHYSTLINHRGAQRMIRIIVHLMKVSICI